jgi:hypothetical protein
MWCQTCALTAQLEHARDRAAVIPELEKKLAKAKKEEGEGNAPIP